MRISLSIENLQDAYDICNLVKCHCGDVIASGEGGNGDKEWHAKSKRFMDAFDRAMKNTPARKQKAKDWKESLEKSMDLLNESIQKLDIK